MKLKLVTLKIFIAIIGLNFSIPVLAIPVAEKVDLVGSLYLNKDKTNSEVFSEVDRKTSKEIIFIVNNLKKSVQPEDKIIGGPVFGSNGTILMIVNEYAFRNFTTKLYLAEKDPNSKKYFNQSLSVKSITGSSMLLENGFTIDREVGPFMPVGGLVNPLAKSKRK